jgi:pimeloyl-ACP methyl ester carboxylesterase
VQPVRIGLGHSLGACLTIVQQAHHRCYDGIAVLGYSVIRNQPKAPPGCPPVKLPWFSREVPPGQPGAVLNWEPQAASDGSEGETGAMAALVWSSYYDDVPRHVIDEALTHYEHLDAEYASGVRRLLPWAALGNSGSAARSVLTPGSMASEAAAITVPVLCALGERDFSSDPHREPQAFQSAFSFDLFECPRMGHLHNFAGTRELLWQRIHAFGQWCTAVTRERA